MATTWEAALRDARKSFRSAGEQLVQGRFRPESLRSSSSDLREASLNLGEAAVYGLEGWLLRSSAVPTTPFLDPEIFPWTKVLEAGWQDIRADLDDVLRHRADLPNFQDISRDVASITDDDQWKTFFFLGYGYRSEANWARCPRTAALLEQIPGLTTAFFSILSPGKHIKEHRGPYRGVLRYHLGLMVPEPAEKCGITVGGETRHWAEGESMLFDDGYLHEAWNDSDGVRAVLFLDVVRPLQGSAEKVNNALLKAIAISPFLRDAKKRHEAWEGRFEKIAKATGADS